MTFKLTKTSPTSRSILALMLVLALLAIMFLAAPNTPPPANEVNLTTFDFSSCKEASPVMFHNIYSEVRADQKAATFSYESKFSTQDQKPLPEIIHFIVTPGNQALHFAGRYVDVFIDASNPDKPIVSAYVFNGLHPRRASTGYLSNVCNSSFVHSFSDRDALEIGATPEALFSTLRPSTSNVVLLANVFDQQENDLTTRTFELTLDTSQIFKTSANYCKNIYHKQWPEYVDPVLCEAWDGISLHSTESKAGLFWFASAGGQIQYHQSGPNSGYIKALSWDACSACLNQGLDTNSSPSCQILKTNAMTVKPGQDFQAQLQFYDPESDTLHLNFQNAPEGLKTNLNIGQTKLFANNNGLATLDLSWTPQRHQTGKHIFSIWATQSYGITQGSTACELELTVESLGDFLETCQHHNSSALLNNLEINIAEIKLAASRLSTFARSAKDQITTIKKEFATVNRLIKKLSAHQAGLLSDFPKQGYLGVCPDYCTQVNTALETKKNSALILSQLDLATKKLGRISQSAARKTKNQKQIKLVTLSLKNALEANKKAQALLQELPEKLTNCRF